MDFILVVQFYQLKMILEENARLIHKIIAPFLLAARSQASSKAIDQASADEISGDLDDDTPNKFRNIILGKVVGHQKGRLGETF
jgi:hypothetical protein